MGGFLASVSQYWISYHVTILFVVLLVCECLFLPETHYPRAAMLEREGRGSQSEEMEADDLKRTKQLGYLVNPQILFWACFSNPATALSSNRWSETPEVLGCYPRVLPTVDIPNDFHQRVLLRPFPILVVGEQVPR